MFNLKYSLQDEVDEGGTPGPAPGETSETLADIDEKDRGDEVSDAVKAMPEDDEGDKPPKTAAELGADEIRKAEEKALGTTAADDETKSDDDKDEKPAAKAPSRVQVPKHRLDAVQAARRAAETRAANAEAALQELQALQNQAPPAATAPAPAAPVTALTEQIDALDKKIDDLTEDGKADEAREARRELRKLERQQVTESAQAEAQAVATESVQQTDLRAAIENIEDAIPALNPDAEGFDKELSNNVNELADAFEASGHAPAEALYKAIEFAIPASADEETEDGDVPADERVEKNIDTATRQPSKLSDASKTSLDSDKAGLRAGKVDVMEMSEKRFDEFVSDEEQEKIARGDFVGA